MVCEFVAFTSHPIFFSHMKASPSLDETLDETIDDTLDETLDEADDTY